MFVDQIVVENLTVGGQGADCQMIAILPNVTQVIQASKVDQGCRRG